MSVAIGADHAVIQDHLAYVRGVDDERKNQFCVVEQVKCFRVPAYGFGRRFLFVV
jgi:hypothetical protein